MRIIFFNIWHGGVWDKLERFIREQSNETDIFCFLETDQDVQVKIQKILSGFNCVFDKGIKTNYLGGVCEGRSIFVSDKIDIEESAKLKMFRTYKNDAGGALSINLKFEGKRFYVGSIHGKARPGTKFDTPIRINQSRIIIDHFKNIDGFKIIGGDFNLNPETESIKMFEKAGYKNLIKEYKIKNTRNQISWKNFNNVQYFADYCFVSKDIKVNNFEVPNVEVSDHEPLILDFEL